MANSANMENESVMPPAWPTIGMTVREAAASLRVDARTVRQAIRAGGLPARLVGRGWRIEEGALRNWLASGPGEGRRDRAAGSDGVEEDGDGQ